MTHATKKILALVLTLALCLSLVVAGIPAFAEDEPTLTIASVEAAPGADAVVAVTATDLPLQGGTEFILNLAEGLTFVSLTATDRALVENNDYSINGNAIKVLGLYGFDNEDLPAVLTLTVKVSDDAEAGSYPITATNVILADGDENLLDPVITGGGVTVVVDEVHEHNYGEWEFDANEHWKTCTSEVGDCDAPVSYRANHEWGDGVVTTAPTVLEAGVRTFTCECGAEKTEEEPKLTAPTTDDDVATVVETDEEIIVDAGDADTVTLTDVIAVAGDKAVAVKTATADIVFEGIEATDAVAFNVVKTEDAEIAGKTGTNFAFTMNNATFTNATITVEYPVTANTKLYHIYGDPVQADEIDFTDNGNGTVTFELLHFSSVLFEEEVVWLNFKQPSFDIANDAFSVKFDCTAEFVTFITNAKNSGNRSIDLHFVFGNKEYVFPGQSVGKSNNTSSISGVSAKYLTGDVSVYLSISSNDYNLEKTNIFTVSIASLLSNSPTPEKTAYLNYLTALDSVLGSDAVADENIVCKSAIDAPTTDYAFTSATVNLVNGSVAIGFNAKNKAIVTAMTDAKNAGNRKVSLMCECNGKTYEFKDQSIGGTTNTATVSSVPIKRLSGLASLYFVITANGGYSYTSEKLTIDVPAVVATSDSDLSQAYMALQTYLAPLYE